MGTEEDEERQMKPEKDGGQRTMEKAAENRKRLEKDVGGRKSERRLEETEEGRRRPEKDG